jgi:serine protease Do
MRIQFMNEEAHQHESPAEPSAPDFPAPNAEAPAIDSPAAEVPAANPEIPAPQEVVEYFQLQERREVVEYYVHNRPLPSRIAAGRPVRKERSRKGLWIFLGGAALITLLTVTACLWPVVTRQPSAQGGDDGKTADSSSEGVSIPVYQADDDVRLAVSTDHGGILTPQQVYTTVNPAVVTVLVQLGQTSASLGTGVIFTSDGYLLTNYHVVDGGSDCSVTLSNNVTYAAEFVAGDADNDIAILKVDATDLPTAEIGSSDDLTVGDKVYAIGNPLGVELRGTFTDGIVSAINRDVSVENRTMTLVQTNAALNSGNSGGPLINEYGQVVGINTIKMSSAFASIEGLGFAIPTSSLQYIVNDLLEYGQVMPEPVLGISVSQLGTTLPDERVGIKVLEVTEGSAADKAGVQVDDVILSADGDPVSTSADLLRVRRRFNAGDQMSMEVYRDGETQELLLDLKKTVED